MALLIGYGSVAPVAGGFSVGEFSSVVGRSETLTGRVEVWADLMSVAKRHPICGGGFGGFWTSKTRVAHDISDAHSGYLEVFLGLGFVGLVLLAFFLLSSCRKAQKVMTQNFYWGALWVCFLLMAVIHNIAESSINSFASHLTAVLLFLTVNYKTPTRNEMKV